MWCVFSHRCSHLSVQVTGSTRNFPKTKEEYIAWGNEDDDGSRGARFKGPIEPYVKPLA